jgi:glutamyl-tRNA synthetase
MAITHVIRGEDHLSNTPKHIALFRALGAEPPQYAHIPLILNPDGTKMSKRDKGASLTNYIEEGYAPEAVVNYLCLLGWSPKGSEKLSVHDATIAFDLPQILRHNARFDFTKLQWLNGEYIREMHPDRFHELAVHALARAGIDTNRFPLPYVKAALDTCKEKVKLFSALKDFCAFYFEDEISHFDAEAAQKAFVPEAKPRLAKLREACAQLASFDPATLESTLKTVAAELGVKAGVLVHPVRLACTGKTIGPSLYHLMAVLGKQRVLQRLDQVLARLG